MYYWIFSSKEPVLYVFYVYIMTINVFWIEKIELNCSAGKYNKVIYGEIALQRTPPNSRW